MANRSYFYSVGKRKTAVARVKIFEGGKGEVTINELPMKKYLSGTQLESTVAPFVVTSTKGMFDVEATVEGGGKAAQADAIRHGIARALLLFNPELRHELKQAGYIRRDSRIKERKKPGLHRARRAPQFSKR